MPESQSGSALPDRPTKAFEPTVATRQLRLARILADMVPGAHTLRISQCGPGHTWPSPFSRAYDQHGRLIPLNRAQGMTAARWVIRAHPEASWNEAHDLDLITGILRPAAPAHSLMHGGR